jgi:serine/threonine protein phosphatase 1
MKIIAFGDIHGCYHAAEAAVRLAEKLKAGAVFLGDYIDRGPSGMKTILALIKARRAHPDWIFLRGNHEQMLMDLIDGKSRPDDVGFLSDGSFFYYAQTEDSYDEWKALKDRPRAAVKEFIGSAGLYYQTRNLIFLHGVLRDTGEQIHEKSAEELTWNYDHLPAWQGKTFIHGHSPAVNVTIKGKGINVNTSCGYKGYLSGVVIDSADGSIIDKYAISETGISVVKVSSNEIYL